MRDHMDCEGGKDWALEWIGNHLDHAYSELTMGADEFDGTSGCAHSDSPPEANLNCVKKGAAV